MTAEIYVEKPEEFVIDSYICETESGHTVLMKWNKKKTLEVRTSTEHDLPYFVMKYYDVRFAGGDPEGLNTLRIKAAHGIMNGEEYTPPVCGYEMYLHSILLKNRKWDTPKYPVACVDPLYLREKWNCPVEEVTQEAVEEILQDVSRDRLLDEAKYIGFVNDRLDDLCGTTAHYSLDREGGCAFYLSPVNVIIVHTECPVGELKSIVIHEMLHAVMSGISDFEMYMGTEHCDQKEADEFLKQKSQLTADMEKLLRSQIPEFERIKDIEHIQKFLKNKNPTIYDFFNNLCVWGSHDGLFWLLSLEIDITLNWPLGKTFGYGMEGIIADILTPEAEEISAWSSANLEGEKAWT